MIKPRHLIIAGLLASMMAPGSTMAQTITPSEWDAYKTAFVSDDGRVIDTGNANISHSEGQGYGLLLSVLSDDRASFERIWSFTNTELMVRDDGLAAWRWEADRTPHIADANNASDGDTLIAYALALAGGAWNDAAKTDAARSIIETLGKTMLTKANGLSLILPGATGFSAAERPDGPVVNPSYWVFEAYPVFAALTPDIDWTTIASDGLELVHQGRVYPAMLPPDWLSVRDGKFVPAEGFPPDFGYNNIRIPIYLMRAHAAARYLKPYDEIGTAEGIGRVQVTTNSVLERMNEPGYRLIQAAIDCTLSGTAIAPELTTFTPSSYYAATLQLLLLDYLRRDQAACMSEAAPT